MNDILFSLAYLAGVSFVVFVPLMLLDWIFGLLYKHNRRFHRFVIRFFRTLPQWKEGRR